MKVTANDSHLGNLHMTVTGIGPHEGTCTWKSLLLAISRGILLCKEAVQAVLLQRKYIKDAVTGY